MKPQLRAPAIVLCVAVAIGLGVAPVLGKTIPVSAGGNLQSAIDQALPGDVITLTSGATYLGNFVLPNKPGEPGYITIRSSTPDASLPGHDGRIGPEHEPLLATIRSPNGMPALRTAPGAHHWRILALRVTSAGRGDLITLGDAAQTDYATVPHDLTFDRVVVRGDATLGQKRGIALNSAITVVRNCYIADIKLMGQETQGMAGWNGPGPFLIENNYVQAAGIGILFGGAQPSLDRLVPSDIVITRNHITRPEEWRTVGWAVKNLLELKNARHVLIEGNLLENNWAGAQSGFAVLFTVRSHGKIAVWSTVEHVRFQNNHVRHVAAGINILGYDYNDASQQARDIEIRNNLFDDLSRSWGGNGSFLLIGVQPAEVHVENNTVLQCGNILSVYGGTPTAPQTVLGFRFVNNVVLHNSYGIFGDGAGVGNPAIARYFPGSTITGNVIAGGSSRLYPTGNFFPAVADLMAQFANASAGDYSLSSTMFGAQPGGIPGADFNEMAAAMAPPQR